MKSITCLSRVTAWSVLSLGPALAAQVGPGNILVSHGEVLSQYTPDGVLVDSRPIPYPTGSHPTTERARDVIRDASGDFHIYNGTFDPYLTTLRVEADVWEHQTHPDWNTSNNVSYGGVGAFGPYVFVSDNLGDGGVVRFDQRDGSSVLFGESFFGCIDLTVGRDGLLYALDSTERGVRAFDPDTLVEVRSFILASSVRGIAVDTNGDVYGASWDGQICHFDATGTQLNSVQASVGSLTDIDIDPFGNLAAGARFGDVVLTDTSLKELAGFELSGTTFVAFMDGSGAGANFCSSLPNSTGFSATLSATGSNSISAADLVLTAAPIPDTPYLFFAGTRETLVPFGDGLRCVTNGMLRYPPAFASGNAGTLAVFPDSSLAPGLATRFQCWFRDRSGGPAGFNTTDGYVLLFVP